MYRLTSFLFFPTLTRKNVSPKSCKACQFLMYCSLASRALKLSMEACASRICRAIYEKQAKRRRREIRFCGSLHSSANQNELTSFDFFFLKSRGPTRSSGRSSSCSGKIHFPINTHHYGMYWRNTPYQQ